MRSNNEPYQRPTCVRSSQPNEYLSAWRKQQSMSDSSAYSSMRSTTEYMYNYH